MSNLPINSEKIAEMLQGGWNAVVEMYKNSDPKQREQILKSVAGLASFGALLKYLKEL